MAIRWDKFTLKAQQAMTRANELATEHGNPELVPLHLTVGLIEDPEGIVRPLLEKIGARPETILNEVYSSIEALPKISGPAAQASMSRAVNQLLDRVLT